MSSQIELARGGGRADLLREQELLSSAAIAHGFAVVLAATVLAVAADVPVWRFVIWARMTLYIQPPDVVAITITGIAFQTAFAIVAAFAAFMIRRAGTASRSGVAILGSVAGVAALFYSYAGLGGLFGMAGACLSLVGAGRAWAHLAPEHFRQPNSIGPRLKPRWLLSTAILIGAVGILVVSLWLAVFAGLGTSGLFYVESALTYSFAPISVLLTRPRRIRATVT